MPAEIVLILAGVCSIAGLWLWIIRKWQRGLEIFLLYTPVSGVVQNLLYPAPWPVLIKDVAFAVPLYIGVFLSGAASVALARIPRLLATAVFLFAALVLVESVNPFNQSLSLIMILIGIKVWLFYLPMLLVGLAYASTKEKFLRLNRFLLCLIWLPCVIGILQYGMSLTIGYERTMRMFYGEAGAAATQGFTKFDVGILRIPSTFSFPAQYLNYILCMFVPVLGLSRLETSVEWQRLRSITFWLLCIAACLCGARAVFLMVPLLLGIFYLIRGRLLQVALPGVLVIAVLYGVLTFVGMNISGVSSLEQQLATTYWQESESSFLLQARETNPLGIGVGSDTNEAASFVQVNAVKGIENYYAKILIELGVVGLLLVVAMHLGFLAFALRTQRSLIEEGLRDYASAVAALLIVTLIYDLKGQAIDFDPLNMLYWLFIGITLQLPFLQTTPDTSESLDVGLTNWRLLRGVGAQS